MKKACVIGGGISGLAAAYLLQQKGWDVLLVETSGRWGGNAYTMEVVVEWCCGKPKTTRWVDMGVNDFNKNTYSNIVKMLDKLNVPYSPLIDQASFTSPGGTFPPSSKDFRHLPSYAQHALGYVNYTQGDDLNPAPPDLSQAWETFKKVAPQDAAHPAYANMSISEYLKVAEAQGKLTHIDLLGKYCLYPRINGMYFTVDDKPEDMPFVGIMQYYVLQEGLGQPLIPDSEPFRQYWRHGTKSWIQALLKALKNPPESSSGVPLKPVQLMQNVSARVQSTASASPVVEVLDHQGNLQSSDSYDAVVFACHASQALRSIRSGVTQDQVNVLSSFSYKQSCTIAHTYTPALPVSKSLWRTYNIFIHEGFSDLQPYVINYVVNLHQNDPANPVYNQFNTPYVLYSINPQVAIPDEFVLRQPILDPKTGEYLRAIAYFPHNVMNVQSMWAQSVLWGTQWPYPDSNEYQYHWPHYESGRPVQGQNGLYFTGGWTLLAGLHEQCWQSAIEVVKLVTEGIDPKNYTYIPNHNASGKLDDDIFMPATYIRALRN